MLIRQGIHRGIHWEITQSETVGFWHRTLALRDRRGNGHSEHLDRWRFDGNPRYIEDEIDRLVRAGLLKDASMVMSEEEAALDALIASFFVAPDINVPLAEVDTEVLTAGDREALAALGDDLVDRLMERVKIRRNGGPP